MSKQQRDWTDEILADSELPADDFTWSDGSNFGMDGFHFNQEMGEGVLDGARLPEVKGLSALPEGFFSEKSAADYDVDDISFEDLEDGIDLGVFLDESAIEKTATLADLGWLDPTSPKNPDRLPENPVDKGVEELTEAWGVNRRTDGLSLVPNRDKEVVDYEKSLMGGPKSDLPGSEVQEQAKHVAHQAMRQSALGHPMSDIWMSTATQLHRLGVGQKFARAVLARIKHDHGLAGNVFIHAVAFPDIHKGKHARKRKAQLRKLGAHYVVVPEGEQRLAVWEAIGLTPVTEVPWKKALAHYGPRLRLGGYRVASKGSPRYILKRAFLGGPRESEHEFTPKPRDIRPADRVTAEEAKRAFRAADPAARPVVADRSIQRKERERRKALVQVAKWAKAGHLTREQAFELARSDDPKAILRKGARLVTGAQATADYDGPSFQVNQPEDKRSAPVDPFVKWGKEHNQNPKELRSLLKWARIQMSEGTAGDELDQLLRYRFSKPLVKAAAEHLQGVRTEHEGLSGHLYVDAGAYASPKGLRGCDKGALRHRSNGLKAVLEMGRCSSCVAKNANGVCSKYNKPLVDSAPAESPKAYQREAIRMANASDAEVTASLFAPAHDQGEFALTDPLSEISFHEAAAPEEVGEFLFGDGMEIEF